MVHIYPDLLQFLEILWLQGDFNTASFSFSGSRRAIADGEDVSMDRGMEEANFWIICDGYILEFAGGLPKIPKQDKFPIVGKTFIG